jgi:hypothetical protein
MISGDIGLNPSAPREPDFLETMTGSREHVIRTIQQAGGIDFQQLLSNPPNVKGGNMHFRVVSGIRAGDVPLAVKTRPNGPDLLLHDYAEQVATMGHIGRKRPDLAHMLPKVHYLLHDTDDEFVGILTEDFTQDGELMSTVETPLWGFADMFSDPAVVDSDLVVGMVGSFFRPASPSQHVLKVVDVTPAYSGKVMYSSDPHSDVFPYYPAWFVEELGIDQVMASIDDLRINIGDIRK